ncbi:MAG: tetratricopeptide repeat protein [Elainellaceae cyanobacterium]
MLDSNSSGLIPIRFIGKALELYQQSLEIAKEIEDFYQQANALNLIGYVYLQLGRYEQAIEFNQQVLEILDTNRIE